MILEIIKKDREAIKNSLNTMNSIKREKFVKFSNLNKNKR